MFSFIGLASSWCLLTETETLVKQTSLLHSFLSAYWMSWGEQLPPSCVPSAMIVSLILDPYNRVRRSRDNSMNKANPFFTLCLLGVVTVKKKKSLSHTAAVVTSKVMNWKQCLPVSLSSCSPYFLSPHLQILFLKSHYCKPRWSSWFSYTWLFIPAQQNHQWI